MYIAASGIRKHNVIVTSRMVGVATIILYKSVFDVFIYEKSVMSTRAALLIVLILTGKSHKGSDLACETTACLLLTMYFI